MGKPKNKTKGKDLSDSDSEGDIVLEEETESEKNKPAGKASKKDRRKKKKEDDWEDDIANELEELSMEANKGREEDIDQNGVDEPVVTKKEKKKKKKGRVGDSDEEGDQQMEEEREPVPAKGGKKKKPVASFQMLMDDDDDMDEGDKSQSEEEKSDEESVPVQKTEPSKFQKKKEKKKKGGKEKTTEEEDVDALLAEIEKPKEKTGKKSKKDKKKEKEAMEAEEDEEHQNEAEVTEVFKVEPKVVTMEDLEEEEEDDRKKRKKKKGKKEEGTEEHEGEKGGEEGDEEGGTMKTAAQKRKEKKEREKLKKMADKKKQQQKKEVKTEEKGEEQEEKSEEKKGEPAGATAGGEEHAEEKGSGDEGEEEGGKKKKKKKKGEKEEKPKKTKKAPVAAIKELLKKQKEEEERLQREEEERIRKEEEAIRLREEQKKLEEEKKQKKKEKEKARKERLKQEGKLLTEKQKQDKRRAMQLLESMKEQGIELPQKDDEDRKPKRPVYDNRKKKKQPQKTDVDSQETKQETPSPEDTPASTPMTEEAPVVEVEVTDKVTAEVKVAAEEEEVKGTWEEEEDTKDAWDASSEEEEEEEEDAATAKEVTKPAPAVKKAEVSIKSQEEEEEEEEESEEEEDSEEEESEEEESEESESSEEEDLTPYERAEQRLMKKHEEFEKKRTTDELRAPVVCVLGHVDTGKTKILDKLRRTNVQDGEAGGITQQIGATNVPEHALREKTTMCKEFQKKELKLPGLLIIDTPGHESFSNLRSRGSSLCDIAILVIDIMHGLEPQTIESINLLKDRKTPFVVALNKIDRLYQWKSNPNKDVMNTIKAQTQMCKQEYDERSRDAITQMAEQGLNAALFYENKNPKEYISMVPTSAHSGDGMGNLVALICELTQTWLAKKLSFTEELHATVMEVKALPGLGTTVDVILVNGTLHEGDQIILAGTEGPIVTQIRGLLMPQPMRELRVKSQYEHHKEVRAAQGVKIIGKDLEKALAGLPMYVAHDDDEVEYYKEEISKALKDILNSIKLTERGVFVQASTLGSLEALLEFLRTEKIPYAGINIGPVHKKDIMRASIMLEHDSQYAVILAFDVKVEREAQDLADNLGVTIFTADIIYHLQDKFTKFREDLKRRKQEEFKHIAVFPCKLRVLPNCIFNSRDPIVIGVSIEAGFVKIGTPICVPSKEFVELGRITSLEVNHKPMEIARKGQEVCIKIENIPGETPKLYGRHFDHTDFLVSKVTRASIDAVKDYFRDDMTKPDWALMVELKKAFQVL